jgi:hypothetical protein
MTASQLIIRLTELQAEHGDLPVVSHGYESPVEITEVSFENPDDEFPLGHFWLD